MTGKVMGFLNIVVDNGSKIKKHWSTLNKLLCSNFHNCCSTLTHTCSLCRAGPQLWQLSWRSLRMKHCTNHSWDLFHLTGESSLWMRRQETSPTKASKPACVLSKHHAGCTNTHCVIRKNRKRAGKRWGYIFYHRWVLGFYMSSELRAKPTQPNWIYQRVQTQSVRTSSVAFWSKSSK